MEIDTFNPTAFQRLKKAEQDYFWFNVRRKWILDVIKTFISPPARFLEVGCGTGNVSNYLTQKGYLVTGCEFYPEAINIAWKGFPIVHGDANNLPFKDNRYDIVGLFDVIEHFEDDISILKEAIRVVKQRGIVVITVPASEELWSSVDDRSLHKRRYTKERLLKIFSELGLNTLLIQYMFMSLYMPMKYLRRKEKEPDNHFRINRIVNTLLKGIFNMERIASRTVPLPTGTSLIGIGQKMN